MAYIPDFNLDDIISLLASISEKRAEDAKEKDAIELAQIALLYTRHIRKTDDFIRYYKEFFDPLFKVKIAQDFATQEEADKWLVSGKANEADLVKIADKGFQVARLPGRLIFIDVPLMEELQKDSEEPETDSE
ncbi:hypothetical protein [Archangium sp.]|uniref:hypothetical protein n=1 Tax=Archangium sp. TaxID=1872627 RepID=UPI002D6A5534|nr:hypothetical protein [Archangium sp.]HYO57481.1 hypothetical protein [Archangium sp.]